MIEIFTQPSDASQAPARTAGNQVLLSRPMDVFLGRNGAGIAYYEKSGADLRITLLDQQEVLVRNFFAIGANGEYSRLLKTQGGEVEVSGLIAPEPFVARDAAPIVAQADAPAAAAPAAPVAATTAPAEVAPAPAPAPAPVITAAAGGVDADGDGGTFDIGWDTGAFFAVNGLILLRALDSGGSNSGDGGAPAADAPVADAPAAGAQVAAAAPAADPVAVAAAAAPVSLMAARFASVPKDGDAMNADDAALLAGMADQPAAQADAADEAVLASLGLGGTAADAGVVVLGAADAVADVAASTVPLDDPSNSFFVI